MKAVMIVLLIFTAACMIFSAAVSGSFGSMSNVGAKEPQSWIFGSDAKRMEDKMARALSGLDTLKRAKIDENNSSISDSLKDALLGASSLDSSATKDTSLHNSSLSRLSETNSTGQNSSAASSSAAVALAANSSAGLQEVGTSSKGYFNGYYGITASRHEIGKSNIKSSMFLSGGFDVEKTVQFSDRGV